MNKEDLKKLGVVDDEIIQKIIVEHGKDIEKHKASIITAQTEVGGLREQLNAANVQIEKIKSMDIEGMKVAANDWKQKAEAAQTKADEQIAAMKFDYALESHLTKSGAKNNKAVRALLQQDGMKLTDDGSIVGLKEQLEKIQTENDYLFVSKTPVPVIITGTQSQPPTSSDPIIIAARKAAGLDTK
jgi:hypothetical protein